MTSAVPDLAPRSYLFNGFSDLIAEVYPGKLAAPIRQGLLSMAVPESRVADPHETILFGEKAGTSAAWELDVLIPDVGFLADLDEARHGVRGHARRGQANYGFADGGVRPLPFGECTCPVNLWGITEASRRDQAICRPR
jgi:prepilin-type processing-associated H-X9-DG protein